MIFDAFSGIKKIMKNFKKSKDTSKQEETISSLTEEELQKRIEKVRNELNDLYSDFFLRINAKKWNELIGKASALLEQEALENTLIEFLMDNYNLPYEVWDMLNLHFNWNENSEALTEKFPEKFIRFLVSSINHEYKLRYELLPEGLGSSYDDFINAYYKAYFALEDKDLYAADRAIQKAQSLFDKHVDLMILEARYYAEIDQIDKALEKLEAVLKINEQEGEAYFERAVIYIRLGELNKACQDYQECIRLMPDYMRAQYHLAGCTLDMGKYKESQMLYNKILLDYPDNQTCLTNLNSINHFLIDELEEKRQSESLNNEDKIDLAKCYAYFGEHQKCYELIENIEETITPTREIYLLLADAARFLEMNDKAEAYYRKIVALQPDDAEIYYKLSKLFNDQNEHEKAIKCLDKVIELKPNYERVYASKGINLNEAGNPLEAIACFDKEIEIDENNWINYYFKAKSLIKLKEYEEAMECVNKAAELSDGSQRAYYMRGIVLYYTKEYEEAIRHFNWCYNNREDEEPESFYAQLFLNAGLSVLKLMEYDNAYEFFERAAGETDGYVPAYAGEILVLLETKKYQEAIERCALALDKQDGGYSAKELVKEFEEELAKYKHLIDIESGYQEMTEAVKSLYHYAKRKEKEEMQKCLL